LQFTLFVFDAQLRRIGLAVSIRELNLRFGRSHIAFLLLTRCRTARKKTNHLESYDTADAPTIAKRAILPYETVSPQAF
jgi:hypothetical protein